ncbi:hypothetical protein OG594_08875 [Streptomyces sp. NBC_01214]|uniref:hypothetical protein n=1 Tax=Streptomyces sp. NBC_01214 TaxID=2903777 RepID=UPI0022578FBC|nr:hypothetical protein [Streptomyces sp. NBC_01214]MCX4801763.1 hypothetical protein [Streptomyces sp. NBC_01214]
MTAQLDHVNGIAAVPRFDPVALAEAEAIRTKAEAEAKALQIKAEGEAKAAEIAAQVEADKQRILNDRAALRAEADKAAHDKKMAELLAATAKAKAEADEADAAAERKAREDEGRAGEERRTEATWKWSARGIYLISLIIALPLQLKAFYSDDKPFMVAAPLLLEGLALVLAFGGAWAIAHRRNVRPYRIGIMAAAAIAAGVNLWHGNVDPAIGIEAGIVGALASLGGPVVLMAYEHGIAQKRDGIPSWRERRDAAKAAAAAAKEAADKAAEKKAAENLRAQEKWDTEQAALAEQKRKDADRQGAHKKVWDVAEAMRSARGLQYVTDQIWGEAWYRVTGSKVVGVWPELEASSRAAQARMKAASEMPIFGPFMQVESQKGPQSDGVDGRRSNGGTPPRRVPGDTPPNSPIARKQAVLEQTTRKAAGDSDERTIR